MTCSLIFKQMAMNVLIYDFQGNIDPAHRGRNFTKDNFQGVSLLGGKILGDSSLGRSIFQGVILLGVILKGRINCTKWINTSGCINVSTKIPDLAAFTSSVFLWSLFICGCPPNLKEKYLSNWGVEIIVLPLDSVMFSIHNWFSSLTSCNTATRALKLCLTANSRICWRFIKGRLCKDARKTAIAVDEKQPISWAICVNVPPDWSNNCWYYKMIGSFFCKGRDTIIHVSVFDPDFYENQYVPLVS